MAHSNNSIVTGKFQGSLGGELVFRDWEGKTVVAKSPKARKGSPTTKQVKTQDKILKASRYAMAVVSAADQGIAEAYAHVLKPRQNVYSRAMEDFLSAPQVTSIDARKYRGLIGDKITLRASDDFRIVNVHVDILAANGSLLEEGDAQLGFGVDWIYTATQANNLLAGTIIRVTATDVPNNEGTLEVTL